LHLEVSEQSPILIKSQQGDYPVDFISKPSSLTSLLPKSGEIFLLADRLVMDLYKEKLGSLVSFPTFLVDANEETKTLEGVTRLIDWLLEKKATRSSHIIALGGGVIQDLATFTSHIYYRGIKWTFIPTTLLSQSDSCIGAKCGINVLPLKNQLGVLHSPAHVVICSDFLNTLPDVEIDSGYGEIYKLSLTGPEHFFDALALIVASDGHRNPEILEVIRRSLLCKKLVIEEDEYELDSRRILNYGHSFGHALEALTKNEVPHGIAVMWGMDIINFLGVKWGITNPELSKRIRNAMEKSTTFSIKNLPSAAAFVRMLARDKKVENGLMYFAVLHDSGDLRMHPKSLDGDLIHLVQKYLDDSPLFFTP